jgi:chromosomal replication initiation ATPase DnaA
MVGAEGQLALRFPYTPALTAVDLLTHPGNALALEFLGATARWPQRRLALWGGQGCGKSHLLHIWAAECGAGIVPGAELREPFWPEGPVAVDDIDRVPSEAALLHLLNAAAEEKRPVLLTASRPPGRLGIQLPDLASRLRAITAIELGAADDAFLAQLFARLLADRQLTVKPEIRAWLLIRLPRSPAALREAVARLDDATLAAKSPITPALAASALADLLTGTAKDTA